MQQELNIFHRNILLGQKSNKAKLTNLTNPVTRLCEHTCLHIDITEVEPRPISWHCYRSGGMPGHVKKSSGPDPDPSHWLYVSYDLKQKLKVRHPDISGGIMRIKQWIKKKCKNSWKMRHILLFTNTFFSKQPFSHPQNVSFFATYEFPRKDNIID